jgi:hypothetical protein
VHPLFALLPRHDFFWAVGTSVPPDALIRSFAAYLAFAGEMAVFSLMLRVQHLHVAFMRVARAVLSPSRLCIFRRYT